MTTPSAIVVSDQKQGFLAPAVTVDDALRAYQAKKDLIEKIMKPGVDFGIIPGTTKNTLLKAGAEKATSFFGLSTRFHDAAVVEDFSGKDHDGEPFFFYRRTCELWRGDKLIASADGSCNSHEKKYRYRNAERVCPTCGQAAIIKGKDEFGGGWVCFKKKGGCGAKFGNTAPEIVNQEVGQIPNPDIADQANTILKMADKRALIAATLIATGMSEYFTQDVEDFIDASFTEAQTEPKPAPKPMTYDEAKQVTVKVKGEDRFVGELSKEQLDWVIENHANAQTVQAARVVLETDFNMVAA